MNFHRHQAFYLYLYIVSMIFLLFMYVTLLWGRPKLSAQQLASNMQINRPQPPPISPESVRDSGEESDQESSLDEMPHRRSHVSIVMPPQSQTVSAPAPILPPRRHSFLMVGTGTSSGHNKGSSHGSFYLRMGAVGEELFIY